MVDCIVSGILKPAVDFAVDKIRSYAQDQVIDEIKSQANSQDWQIVVEALTSQLDTISENVDLLRLRFLKASNDQLKMSKYGDAEERRSCLIKARDKALEQLNALGTVYSDLTLKILSYSVAVACAARLYDGKELSNWINEFVLHSMKADKLLLSAIESSWNPNVLARNKDQKLELRRAYLELFFSLQPLFYELGINGFLDNWKAEDIPGVIYPLVKAGEEAPYVLDFFQKLKLTDRPEEFFIEKYHTVGQLRQFVPSDGRTIAPGNSIPNWLENLKKKDIPINEKRTEVAQLALKVIRALMKLAVERSQNGKKMEEVSWSKCLGPAIQIDDKLEVNLDQRENCSIQDTFMLAATRNVLGFDMDILAEMDIVGSDRSSESWQLKLFFLVAGGDDCFPYPLCTLRLMELLLETFISDRMTRLARYRSSLAICPKCARMEIMKGESCWLCD